MDAYSDIDMVCYVRDGYVGDAMVHLESCLSRLGALDLVYEEPGRPENNRYKVYHLEATPDSLLIDVTFQSETFPVSFLYEDLTVVPVVLVDKANVVKFGHADPETTREQLCIQLVQAQGCYGQRSRAIKYTHRKMFLEALIYYQKYVLGPLVDLLRIAHTPYQPDACLVHATRDFPPDVVTALETLYAVRSVEDIAERIMLADDWFQKALVQAEQVVSELDR